MKYAHVSVKFPRELDEELERFLEETGLYTNKSEFIKESVRRQLQTLQDDAMIAALRVEQMLTRAEQRTETDKELADRLDELRAAIDVDDEELQAAVEHVRAETAERTFKETSRALSEDDGS